MVNASSVTVTGNVVQGNNKGLVMTATGPTCPNISRLRNGRGLRLRRGHRIVGVDHSVASFNIVQNNAGDILLADDTGATHDNIISDNNVSNNPLDCCIRATLCRASHSAPELPGR